MSFSTLDTIVAIATPSGRGGLGVVRVSGPDAALVALRLTGRSTPFIPRYATLSTLRAADGEPIDQGIVTFFAAPASYTGEDVVEISAHGSPVVLQSMIVAAIAGGARLAEPGEFTLRAFLNGCLDLAQAEAIGDLIDAVTPQQARAAFDQLSGTLTDAIREIDRTLFDLAARLEASVDFPDEGYHFVDPSELTREFDGVIARLEGLLRFARRGRLIREGLQVAIVGPPNAGKSSLFNALVGVDRAIVNETPGTTRDLVTEALDVEGIHVTLVDTAGLRETSDPVEAEGVRRASRTADVSQMILSVADLSLSEVGWSALGQCAETDRIIRVGTKCDLPHERSHPDVIEVSAVTGDGLQALRRLIARGLDVEHGNDVPPITNIRHIALVERAVASLQRARAATADAGAAASEEFVLADMQDARLALEEITGRRTSDDLLAHIFSTFCIGK